jgi:hypothetical protein
MVIPQSTSQTKPQNKLSNGHGNKIGRRHHRWRLCGLDEQTKSQVIQPSLRRWSRTNSKYSATGGQRSFRHPIRSSSAGKWCSSRGYLYTWTIHIPSGHFTTECRRISCFGCADSIDTNCDSLKSVRVPKSVLAAKVIVIIQPVGVGEAVLEARFPGKRLSHHPKRWYVYIRAYRHIRHTYDSWISNSGLFFFPFQYEKDQLSNCLAISCVQDL